MCCMRCGKYAQQKVDDLQLHCQGRPAPLSSGDKARRRLELGLHPHNVGGEMQNEKLASSNSTRIVNAKSQYSKHSQVQQLASGEAGGKLQQLRERVRARLNAKHQIEPQAH